MMCWSLKCSLVIASLISVFHVSEVLAQNEIMESNYNRDPIPSYNNQGGGTWFDTARNALAGPAGKMVVHMAKEMLSRSAGNSQILSLNLTNLLVLVLLKALIFAAGLLGAGNWGQYARGRSLDNHLLNEDERPLFIGFLAAKGSGQDGCLSLAACQAPETATEYLKAAKAVVKGAEMFDNDILNMTIYSNLIYQVEQSVREGKDGAPCETIYQCRI